MSTMFYLTRIKCIKNLGIILFINFVLLVLSNSVFAQDSSNFQANSNSVIEILNRQTLEVEKLKFKINKLLLIVKTNKNLVLKNEMKNMHGINQFISLTVLLEKITTQLEQIFIQLHTMTNTEELIRNEDTLNNLMALIDNTKLIKNGIDEMVRNIEESQRILSEHNAK